MVGFVAAFNYLQKISKLPFMVESVHASEDDRHAVDVHRVRDNGLNVLCVTFFTFEDGLIAEMHSFADQPQTWVSYLAENPAWSR
jgi:ketosteroid isomerase-like protein